MKFLWVFNGENSHFASAVFSSEELAVAWIDKNQLSGTLTQYIEDVPALDWAVQQGWFTPSKEHHTSAKFAQSFTSASQPHRHFKDGVADA